MKENINKYRKGYIQAIKDLSLLLISLCGWSYIVATMLSRMLM